MSTSDGIRKVAAALGDAQKGHAKIQQRERIRAILEAMIGKPIPEARGLSGVLGGIEPIPDFERHATAETRDELLARITALDTTVKYGITLLETLKSDEIERTSLQMSAEASKGLSFDNALRLNGIVPSAISALAHVVVTAERALEEAQADLRTQFQGGPGRPRDERAYRVADELARFYLRHRKEKPTYAAGYKGKPSGHYTKALTDLFKVLGIKAGVRGPAEAAIASITDDEVIDARREISALSPHLKLGGLGGF